jgi:predicted nucleotidyltransferase
MLLQRYLETLLGSKTKVRILRTLNKHRGKEFTIRELSALIGTSHTGARKALRDLYEMNAVTLRAAGRSHTVALNERSVLYPTLADLFRAEDETMEELIRDLREGLCSQPAVESAKLFGSVARGEEGPRSDIDLLITSSDREKAEEIVTELQILCSNKYGNPIMPLIAAAGDGGPHNSPPILDEGKGKYISICG